LDGGGKTFVGETRIEGWGLQVPPILVWIPYFGQGATPFEMKTVTATARWILAKLNLYNGPRGKSFCGRPRFLFLGKSYIYKFHAPTASPQTNIEEN